MKLLINRWGQTPKQTTGIFSVVDEKANIVFYGKTLELAWNNNEREKSCIPCGVYRAKKHVSQKFGECFHILNVKNRDAILIHAGNFYKDTKGCILVGSAFKDLNVDGEWDVVNSKNTLSKLLTFLPDEFIVEICDPHRYTTV